MTKDGGKKQEGNKIRRTQKTTDVRLNEPTIFFDPWRNSSLTRPGNPLPGAGFFAWKKSWATSDGEVLLRG